MVDFDEVLERIGGWKKYQIYHYILIGLAALPAGMHTLVNVFVIGLPDYWCHMPDLANQTKEHIQRASSPLVAVNGHREHSKCSVFDVDYSNSNVTWKLNGNISYNENDFPTRQCSEWDYDKELFGNTIVDRWDLVCGNAWKRAVAQSIYMLGFLVGAIGFGSLSDKIGRKTTWLLALAVITVSGVVAAFSPNYWIHVWARFVSGTAAAGSLTCGFVLCTEIIGVESRMSPGVFYQGWFAVGYMVDALVAYFVRDYRSLELVISLYPVIFIAYYWLVDESPRWLLARNQNEKAKAIVRKAARMNGVNYPEDLMEKTEEKKPDKEPEEETTYTIVDLLRTPYMRWNSLNIFFNWFVNSLVFYGLSMSVADLGGSPYVNLFISGAVEFPGYLVCTMTVDRIGRRLPLMILMVGGGLSCLLTLAMPEDWWIIITILAMLGKLGISGSFALIYVFSAEIFPTVVRTMGVGAGSMHARIAGLIAPFIAELGKVVWKPLPVLIFGSLSVAAGLLALLLPETLHQKLPETIEDGEEFAKQNRPRWPCLKKKSEKPAKCEGVAEQLLNGHAQV